MFFGFKNIRRSSGVRKASWFYLNLLDEELIFCRVAGAGAE